MQPTEKSNYWTEKLEEEQQFLSEASYIIYKEEDTGMIYARNGDTGNIDYSGTDAATVIQNAIDAMYSGETKGGKLFIRRGEYTINSTIFVRGRLQIEGEGITSRGGGTVLRLGNNVNCNMFEWNGTETEYFFEMHDIFLDGNSAANTDGNGLYLRVSDTSNHLVDIHIYKIFVWDFPKTGIYIAWGWGAIIEDVVVEECGEYGIYIAYSTHCGIFNSKIASNNINIRLGTSDAIVVGCNIGGADQTGLYLHDSDRAIISSCNIHDNSHTSTNTYDDILLKYVQDAIIANCYIDGNSKSKYNIEIGSNCQNIFISNNRLTGAVTAAIDDSGTDTVIRNNIGFTTENSGSATISNGNTSVTVNHGLTGTPTTITLTGGHSEVKDAYVTNVGSTSFDITVDSAVTADRTVYWYAEYKP